MKELDWIAEAKKHLGKREVGNTNTSKDIEQWQEYLLNTPIKKGHYLYGVPWCGTFVAYYLKHLVMVVLLLRLEKVGVMLPLLLVRLKKVS